MSDDEQPKYIKSTSRQWRNLKPLARQMRHEPTSAEALLWQELRGSQVQGAHFRRQHAIGPFVVDFVCIRHRLIVEVDGNIHNHPDNVDYDRERQAYLEAHDFRVLRFTNDEVLDATSEVVSLISKALKAGE